MGARVQYNPSTLKVKYTPGTSKVQVISCDCALCDTIPFEITVTFEGITDDTDCCNYNGDSKIYDGGGAASINGVHTLVCSTTYQESCCWAKMLTGDFGTIDFHAGVDCGFYLSTGDITAIPIFVTIYESVGIKYTDIRAGLISPTFSPGAFFHDTLTFVDAADCLNIGNTFTNEATCSQYQIGTGGTAVITL